MLMPFCATTWGRLRRRELHELLTLSPICVLLHATNAVRRASWSAKRKTFVCPSESADSFNRLTARRSVRGSAAAVCLRVRSYPKIGQRDAATSDADYTKALYRLLSVVVAVLSARAVGDGDLSAPTLGHPNHYFSLL